MYVGVLNTQKTALIDDADQLRSRLNEGLFLFVSPYVLWNYKNRPDLLYKATKTGFSFLNAYFVFIVSFGFSCMSDLDIFGIFCSIPSK